MILQQVSLYQIYCFINSIYAVVLFYHIIFDQILYIKQSRFAMNAKKSIFKKTYRTLPH